VKVNNNRGDCSPQRLSKDLSNPKVHCALFEKNDNSWVRKGQEKIDTFVFHLCKIFKPISRELSAETKKLT